MEESAKRAVERGLAWCGPVFMVMIVATWAVMGHNLPPPNMLGMSAEELVNSYYGSHPMIAPGMVAAATFALFYTIWSCLLASKMRDETGQLGPLSLMELSGGILTGWLMAFCSAMWAACAVMANEVSPDVIKLVHTLTWFIFDLTYIITSMQMVGLGLWTVLNKRQTIFPAWAGWTSIAIGISFVPLVIMPFVSEGPFTVGGLWNFWIIFSAWFGPFFGVYNFYMLKHVYRTADEQRRAAGHLATS